VVSERFGSSVNVSVLDAVGRAPLGSGLGMAFGTSIPYFLADSARPQIGMESEYARIAVEQGVLGLVLWVCFIGWVLIRVPNWTGRAADAAGWAMWIFCASAWVGAVIGTGVLASVPLTMLLLLQMGALVERKARHSVLVTRVGAWPVPVPFASAHSREPSAPRLT
jgi:O-antigen ligase